MSATFDPTGTWRLLEFVVLGADDRRWFPFGTGARGMIVYAPGGTMSAVLSATDRPAASAGTWETATDATDEEKVRAFDSYVSYCGTWTVQGDEILHHVEQALVPNLIGTILRRRYQSTGDTLRLEYDRTTSRGLLTYRLDWRRDD